MQHLLKVLNHQGFTKKSPGLCKRKGKYLCYKINGFWFRLNCYQWAEFRGIKPSTLYRRVQMEKPIEEILGYKKIPMGFAIKKHEEN